MQHGFCCIFLPLFFFIIILLQIYSFDTRFGATLSLLTEQVDFALLIFLLLLPNIFFSLLIMKKTPFSIIIIIVVQDILTYFDIVPRPCVYIILKYYYFLIFLF